MNVICAARGHDWHQPRRLVKQEECRRCGKTRGMVLMTAAMRRDRRRRRLRR